MASVLRLYAMSRFLYVSVVLSQSRIVPSQLPVATVFPSGLNATVLTDSVCPVSRSFSL